MGARSGGSGSGFGGGTLSDTAISRMAKVSVPGKAINVPDEPQLLSGEIIADYSSSANQWIGARSPKIEQQVKSITDNAPAKPTSKKGYSKYVKDYNAFHEKYMAAMKKSVNDYKTLIGKTKNKGLKSLLASEIQKKQGYMKDAIGVKDWINKQFGK